MTDHVAVILSNHVGDVCCVGGKVSGTQNMPSFLCVGNNITGVSKWGGE